MAIGDLDGNTTPDLTVANRDSSTVSILINMSDVQAPGAFALTVPADGAAALPLPDNNVGWGIAPALRWTRPNSFAEPTYDVKVATDPGLVNIVVQASGLTQRQFTLPIGTLQTGTTYFWGVTAFNQAGSKVSTPVAASFGTAGPCAGDANADGIANFADITAILSNWLNTCP